MALYLDILVLVGLLAWAAYHWWLCHKIHTQPHSTVIGSNGRSRRLWIDAIFKEDNGEQNKLSIETLRNMITEFTFKATTAIILCTGLTALLGITYNMKTPLHMTLYGEKNEFMMAIKYVSLLLIFLLSFICFLLAIIFTNQVNFLICCVSKIKDEIVTSDYVLVLLDRVFKANIVGNRIFILGLILLLWIFSPVLVVICILIMTFLLYKLDITGAREPRVESVDVQLPPQLDEHSFLTSQIGVVEESNPVNLQQTQLDESSTLTEIVEEV